MKVRIFASTHPGYQLSTYDALKIAGIEAGICYMPEDFDTLLMEPDKRTFARVRGTVGSGHHSVAGHPSYCLILENIPKIVAMLLNNERDYNTSEKSGRYTVMHSEGEELRIYEKWCKKFEELISAKYPEINPKTVRKLALENARYFISVFTPSTTMGYTVDLRQLNYLIGFCDTLLDQPSDDLFITKLKPWVRELAALLRSVANVEGLRDNKGREFSLFAKRAHSVQWGECYSTNYYGSFAQLAQAHRHRSIVYDMKIPDLSEACFYVPPILEESDLVSEYLADMFVLRENYPQGMLVLINERGTAEDFCKKCHERLCGAAQLEICLQTEKTLREYMSGCVRSDDPNIYMLLSQFLGKTKCQLGYYKCDRPCPLGPQHAFDRLV